MLSLNSLKTIWKNKLSQRSTLWICINFISVCHKGFISYLPNTIPGSLNHPWEQHLIHVKDVRKLGLKDISSKSVRRPEMQSLSASEHYDSNEAEKYAHCNRSIMIQKQLAEAALEILFPGEDELGYNARQSCRLKGYRILDIGCGNAISTEIFVQKGAFCCGLDASIHMMNKAAFGGHGREDFLLANIAHSLPFRKGAFDAIVSISTLQWLFANHATTNRRLTPVLHQPNNSTSAYSAMLLQLFKCWSRILCKDGKVVIQFYPHSIANLLLVIEAASDSNIFQGAIFCIYPHENRGKKLFLYLCQSV